MKIGQMQVFLSSASDFFLKNDFTNWYGTRFSDMNSQRILRASDELRYPRTTGAQRGDSLHCTAENSLPLPNF